MSDTTEDDFLGGRVRIRQPVRGYRAGIDPVLLAASVPAKVGQTVLELGTGSGVALICLMARVSGLRAVGVEREAPATQLARDNAKANAANIDVVQADLTELPPEVRAISFDHVLANPPFFDRRQGDTAENPGREAGRGTETPIPDWIETAVRRLRPGGYLSLIQRTERLPEVLAALDNRMGDVQVLPVATRMGRSAKLFILQAKKGAKGPMKLLAPFVLHEGARHLTDGDDYAPEATAILRDGQALELQKLANR